MRKPLGHSAIARIAALTLCTELTACGGGGSTVGTGGSSSAMGQAAGVHQPASGGFSLGLVNAAPDAIAHLAHIRHVLGVTVLPPAVDLSAKMPTVGDQGQEGSCVAWASAYALRGYEARQDVWSSISPKSTDPALNFSAAFVYNQVNGGHDWGTTIPAALGLLQQKGAATLADMPYAAGHYTVQPSAAAFADAAHYKLGSYGYIAPTDLNSMKVQLATGIPVILAIKVYYNFFLLGQNQIYNSTSGAYEGGHAIAVVGYDDSKGAIEIINSWGPYWGSAGYGWISYAAVNQIAVEAYSAIDDHGAPPLPVPTMKPSTTPSPSPWPTATVRPSPTPTATLRPSPTPTATIRPSPTPTAVVRPSPTPTATGRPSPSPTSTVRPSPTPASTVRPSPTPTATVRPSPTPS